MLFLKSTNSLIAPGVFAIDVAAMPPGKTFMIYLAISADQPPQELVAALQEIGFIQINAKPYKHGDGTQIVDLHFQKKGSDIFEGWTDGERDANLQVLEQTLGKFDISFTPRVMTLAEAFG